MTHKLTAGKVDKPATIPQRSAAAARNEMATDIAAESHSGLRWHFPECGPVVESGLLAGQYEVHVYDDSAPAGSKLPCIVFDANEAGAEQRARLVVHAVNSYDALRTANAELVEALKQIEAHHAARNDEVGRPQERSKTLSLARAALAKHGGAANV